MDNARALLTELYDRYGPLLTEKQRLYFEERYLEDLSLSEIAENEGISKQGVRDLLLRAENTLARYEDRLGFAEKLRDVAKGLEEAERLLERRDAAAALAVIGALRERVT